MLLRSGGDTQKFVFLAKAALLSTLHSGKIIDPSFALHIFNFERLLNDFPPFLLAQLSYLLVAPEDIDAGK